MRQTIAAQLRRGQPHSIKIECPNDEKNKSHLLTRNFVIKRFFRDDVFVGSVNRVEAGRRRTQRNRRWRVAAGNRRQIVVGVVRHLRIGATSVDHVLGERRHRRTTELILHVLAHRFRINHRCVWRRKRERRSRSRRKEIGEEGDRGGRR